MDSRFEDIAAKPLALIERLDRDGHVLQSIPVHRWPVSIGRAFDSDLVLDDPHVAAMHADLDEVQGTLRLNLRETINGATVGSHHLSAGQSAVLAPAQVWRLGATRLRVRRPGDPVAPEQPLARHLVATPVVTAWTTVMLWLLAAVLWLLGQQWLDSDPSTPINTYFSNTLTTLLTAWAWALMWALGSKLFQGRLQYATHLKLALRYGLGWAALVALMSVLAFVTGWDLLSRTADAVGAVVLCMLVWSHLSLILPGHRQGVAIVLVSLYLSGVGLNLWFNQQRQGQWFSELYASTLPPPSWRLAPAHAPSALVEDARSLRARLDGLAKDDEGDAETGGDSD